MSITNNKKLRAIFRRPRRLFNKLLPTRQHKVTALVILLALFMLPSAWFYRLAQIDKRYELAADARVLLGQVSDKAQGHLKYDAKAKQFVFNEAAISVMSGTPVDKMTQKTGMEKAGDKNTPAYGAKAEEGSGVLEVFDTQLEISFKLRPMFDVRGGRNNSGHMIYPLKGVKDAKLVYSPKSNGIKEDIIIDKAGQDSLKFDYKLELPKSLEARLLDSGDLGIYSVDPALLGEMSFGSDADRTAVEAAKTKGQKGHLAFVIPRPVIKESGQNPGGNANAGRATFKYENNVLTVDASGLSKLRYPISIDPSVVVTSSADFATGNNEGNISFGTDTISTGGLTGGNTGSWATTTAFTTSRNSPASAVYNGYIYVLGGNNGSSTYYNDVQYAPLNSTTGAVGTWATTTSFTTARSNHSTVIYNGYIYVIGGRNGSGPMADVQYAKINSDGTIGTWNSTTAGLPGARSGLAAVAYNGYLYAIGGFSSNLVYMAAMGADGNIGSWSSVGTFSTMGRSDHSAVVYNGYMYVMAGFDQDGFLLNDVRYAQIKSDGTLSSWSSTTSLPAARTRAAASVYNGYMYVMGGYDGSNNKNTVYYAPINANGTISSWSTGANLSTVLNNHSAVTYNGYLYALGGGNGVPTNTVQYSKVNPPGITSAFSSTSSMSANLSGQKIIAHEGYMYAVGGYDGTNYVSDVYYAAINSDGTLGAWTATLSLPYAVADHQMVFMRDYMYVIGGQNSTGYLSDVTAAHFNTDGSISSWDTETSLPAPRAKFAAVYYNSRIYVLGGITTGNANLNTSVSTTYLDENYEEESDINSWLNAGANFATARYGHAAAVWGGYIYILGGQTAASTYRQDVQRAPITTSIGTWTATGNTNLPTTRTGLSAHAYNGYIFAFGGNNASYAATTTHVAQINPSNGAVGSWTANTTLGTAKSFHGSAVYGGKVYLAGGMTSSSARTNTAVMANLNVGGSGKQGTWQTTGTYSSRITKGNVAYNGYMYMIGGSGNNTIQYTQINPDGSLGSWTTNATNLPHVRSGTAVAYNGYMYALGGEAAGGYEVQYAPINANGSIGTWQQTNSYPSSRDNFTAAVYNGYIYITAGFEEVNAEVGDVYYAPINTDGTLGTWQAGTSLPEIGSNASTMAYNGYLYSVGGDFVGYGWEDVYYAPINSDGSIGSWQSAGKTDGARYNANAVIYNGYLYFMGGYDFSYIDNLDEIRRAPIAPNGKIGAWETASPGLPRISYNYVTYNGTLYMLGGSAFTGGTVYNVMYSPLDSMPTTGRYSRLIDLGGAYPLASLNYTGTPSARQVDVTYRTACTNTFSAVTDLGRAIPGTNYSLSGNARYVWASYVLNNDFTFGGTNLSLDSFNVNYAPIHPEPDVRMRGGVFFSAGAEQGLDVNPETATGSC